MPKAIEGGLVAAFKDVTDRFGAIKALYDTGTNPIEQLYLMGVASAFAIANHTTVRTQGELLDSNGNNKKYDVFISEDGLRLSRPVRRDLYLKDPIEFERAWADFARSINPKEKKASSPYTNAAIYTCICAVACAYDIFKPTSRKTPGTFFEVLVGSLISEVSNISRGRQVSLPDTRYKVPTDILLSNPSGSSLVVATKITTRERIVQVWAQQRILQDAFKSGAYYSILVAMSELQRSTDLTVNEICVPGQVGLFQRYLAKVAGLYYLDVPRAYCSSEISGILPVKDLGALLSVDLKSLLTEHT